MFKVVKSKHSLKKIKLAKLKNIGKTPYDISHAEQIGEFSYAIFNENKYLENWSRFLQQT